MKLTLIRNSVRKLPVIRLQKLMCMTFLKSGVLMKNLTDVSSGCITLY